MTLYETADTSMPYLAPDSETTWDAVITQAKRAGVIASVELCEHDRFDPHDYSIAKTVGSLSVVVTKLCGGRT